MREYLQVKAGQLKHPKDYIRQSMGPEEDVRCLGRNYSNQPWYPIICSLDWEVADGNRRLEGVLLEFGPDAEVPVCRTDEIVDESVKLEIMLESAIHTRGLSHYEQFLGFTRWLELNRGATAEALAKRFNRTASKVSRTLSLRKAIQPIREAAQAGLIGPGEWSEYTKYDERQQHEMWSARMSGQLNSRDDVVRAGRKARNGNGSSVRLNRIKCPLQSGVTVTVSGEAIGLDEGIDALVVATKEMKRARDEGLDAKTSQAVWLKRLKKAAG